MRVGFVGGGVMAEAIIRGMLAREVVGPGSVLVAEPVEARRQHLQQRYHVGVTADNREAAAFGELVLLAVKPQTFPEVARDLHGHLQPSQTVLSILAGTTIGSLTGGLGHRAVVRVMPNTPAQIGWGMSVWTATPQVPAAHREAARAIVRGLGEEVEVAEEKYIDMATALSASGPAYVFLFLAALMDAGVYLGMPREMARALVLQTVLGSAQLVKETGQHPAQLRDMVTSPAGTTIEALLTLEREGFHGTVMEAVAAAYEKALRLGGQK